MEAYSKDLRVRLIRSVETGSSARAQAEVFTVSPSTAVKWMQAFRRDGQVEAKPRGGNRPSPLIPHTDWLLARVAETPDVTLKELRVELKARGLVVGLSSLSRFFTRAGFSFKKKRFGQRARS